MWLGRGINLGNALDALADATPVLELTDHHFDVVKEAGFDTPSTRNGMLGTSRCGRRCYRRADDGVRGRQEPPSPNI
jgi:hypothetical protein